VRCVRACLNREPGSLERSHALERISGSAQQQSVFRAWHLAGRRLQFGPLASVDPPSPPAFPCCRVKSYEGKLATLTAINSALQSENEDLRRQLKQAAAPTTKTGAAAAAPSCASMPPFARACLGCAAPQHDPPACLCMPQPCACRLRASRP
jgi:hypothetical protein